MVKVAVFSSLLSGPGLWRQYGLVERSTKLLREIESHQVDLSCFYYGSRDEEFDRDFSGSRSLESSSIAKMPRPLRFLLSFLYPLKHFSELRKYDALLSLQVWGAWVPALAKIVLRKKFVLRTGYDHYFFKLRQNANPGVKLLSYLTSFFSYQLADEIVITSKEQKNFICETFKVHPNKVHVLYNYIDTDVFSKKNADRDQRDIIYVGRLNHQKNLKNLINGCHEAGRSLDIVGFGELESELRELSESLGADVNFLGKVDNSKLPEVLANSKAFALVSEYEGNPKTLLEAMACEKPIIAANSPGIEEVAKAGQFGVCTETDSHSIAEGIQKLFSSPEHLEEYGKNARQYILENCSLKESGRYIAELLKS